MVKVIFYDNLKSIIVYSKCPVNNDIRGTQAISLQIGVARARISEHGKIIKCI